MATTPVAETETPAPETTPAAPDAGDELIHKPEPEAITSTDSLPESDPTPKTDSPDGDVKPEPEPGKEPEAKQEEPAAPTLESLAADVTNLTERNTAQETAHQTQVTELKTANELAEKRAAEAESQTTEGQLAQRVIAYRDATRANLKAAHEDWSDAEVETETINRTQAEWDRYLASQARTESDQRVTKAESERDFAFKTVGVDALMRDNGVPTEQRHLLFEAQQNNADIAKELAVFFGEAEKNRVQLEKLTQAQVPADDPSNDLDKGGDLATMTDQQIFDGFGAGTHSDTAAAEKAGKRLGLI